MKKSIKLGFKSPFSSKNGDDDVPDSGSLEKTSANTKKSKATKPSMPLRSLTDEEYEELFNGVLQGLDSDCHLDVENIDPTRREYATLQDAITDADLDAAVNFALDCCAKPEEKRQMLEDSHPGGGPGDGGGRLSRPVTPSRDAQPAWRAVSPVSRIKEDNRLKQATKRKKAAESKPGFSLGNFRKEEPLKSSNKIRKPKGLSSVSGGDTGNNRTKRTSTSKVKVKEKKKSGKEKSTNVDASFNLLQECTKGLWVRCAERDCGKWRYLRDEHDPVKFHFNKDWMCKDSTDMERNNCDAPAQHWSEDADWTYNAYTEGSLVWARMTGYPWWPAIVEIDPDYDAFVFCYESSKYTPVQYHVTFFDIKPVTRSWMETYELKPLTLDNIESELKANKTVSSRLKESVDLAKQCLEDNLTLAERLGVYGFKARYKGSIIGPSDKSETQRQSKGHGSPVTSSKGTTIAKNESPTRLSRPDKPERSEHAVKKTKSSGKKMNRITKRSETSNERKPRKETSKRKRSVSPLQSTCADRSRAEANVTMTSLIDMDKELDEIEQILSQSSQSLMLSRAQSLSPAPNYRLNTSISSHSQRNNSQSQQSVSNSQLQSQSRNQSPSCSQSQSQARTQDQSRNHSPSTRPSTTQTQPTPAPGDQLQTQCQSKSRSPSPCVQTQSSQPKSRSVSPAPSQPGKKPRKGFKCPVQLGSKGAKPLDSSVFTQELSGKSQALEPSSVTMSNPKPPANAKSVFTSASSLTDQSAGSKKVSVFTSAASLAKDTADQPGASSGNSGINLPDNSVFTQELSGEKAVSQPPAKTGLNLPDNSVFTHELSGEKAVSQPPARSGLNLPDNSVFTQELSGEKAVSQPSARSGLNLPENSVFTQELSGEKAVSQPPAGTGLKLPDNSVFTQELSGEKAVSQPSARSGLNLPENSVFTQELSGEKAVSQPPARTGLNLPDNSVFTQELSGEARTGGLNLNNSVFTQELSNKVTAKGKSKGARGRGKSRVEDTDAAVPVDDYGSYSEDSFDNSSEDDADETMMSESNKVAASKRHRSERLIQNTSNEA